MATISFQPTASNSFISALPSVTSLTPTNAFANTLPTVPGLVLWLDAADIGTQFLDTTGASPVTATGQSVAYWKDKTNNNFYTQTYNWNVYCPKKIPNNFMDMDYILNNRHEITDYKTILG